LEPLILFEVLIGFLYFFSIIWISSESSAEEDSSLDFLTMDSPFFTENPKALFEEILALNDAIP